MSVTANGLAALQRIEARQRSAGRSRGWKPPVEPPYDGSAATSAPRATHPAKRPSAQPARLIATLALLLALAQPSFGEPGEADAGAAVAERRVAGEAAQERAPDQAPEEETEEETLRGLETMVVTARKREESLQSVPAAVSAFSESQLDQAGITQMQDISFQVPNLHYGQEQGAARITIRGVSTGAGTDQSTAIHLDGVYQNRSDVATALTFFDLSRVEVLRGPQGTLYGRNATGGAINVISAPPTQEFELFGDVQFGTYHQVLTRAVLNVPLLKDVAAFRASGYYDTRDGYQKNGFVPGPSDDADDADDAGLRTQLLLTPIDDLDITLRFNYFQKKGVGYALKKDGPFPPTIDFPVLGAVDMYAGATPNPEDPRRVSLDTAGALDARSIGGNVNIEWYPAAIPRLGETKLRVLGSVTQHDRAAITDQDASDNLIVNSEVTADNLEWVSELNWSSVSGDEIEWIFGLFHMGSQVVDQVLAPAFIPVPLPGGMILPVDVGIEQNFDRATYSVASYFNLSYDITDELRVEGGLRYSHDWKSSHRTSPLTVLVVELVPGAPLTVPLFSAIDDPRSDDWGRVSGTIGLDYEFDADHMVYGKFSSGYKSGALNNDVPLLGGPLQPPGEDIFSPPDATPEDIFALEIGSKNQFLDNHLRANATVFGYYYRDLQVSQIVESQNFVDNGAAAFMVGIELETMWRPWRELTLTGLFSYLHSEFTEFVGCIDASDPLNALDCTGNELPRAPRFTATFVAQYDFDLGRFGTFTPRMQVFGSDEVFFRATNFDIDRQGPYALLNFRFMWASEDNRFGVELFIDNALDEDIGTTKYVGSSLLGGPIFSAYDRPRTAGIRVSLGW